VLHGIRDILWPASPAPSGRHVRRQLSAYLATQRRLAPQRGRGAYRRRFIEHAQKVTASYAKGLFHCYDDPRIPQTSNAIESINGSGKMNLRRCAGRASTANGQGSSAGRAHMFGTTIHRAMPGAEVDEILRHYSIPAYRESKKTLDKARAPSSQRRSFLRNPIAALKEILGRWMNRSG
jgi:hypothetical protein